MRGMDIAGFGMKTGIDGTYTHLRTGTVAGQRQVAADVIVDVDADNRVLGIETLGDVAWESAVVSILLAARVPRDTWPS
jgi:uncharacterized protein YuzE